MAITSARAIVNIKEKGHFEPQDARIEKYTLGDELPEKLSELRLHARPMASPPPLPAYTVRVLHEQDRDQVLQFLRRWFFRDEPMNQAVELLDGPDARCIELEEYAASTLHQGVSVAAVDSDGAIVGLIINGIALREESEDPVDKSEDCPNEKFRRILKVLMLLEREARVWSHLPPTTDSVLEVRIASVDSSWRGRNIMRVLCEETERIATEKGISACRMDCTSRFSAAVASRLGYREIYRVAYAAIPDAPQPPEPHLYATVYIKML